MTSQDFQSLNSEQWLSLHSNFHEEIVKRVPDDLGAWVQGHRKIGGQPFILSPALRDLYADQHEFIVIQKGSQVGISEYMLNFALWAADTGQGGRGNVLYAMPTERLGQDFVSGRVDRAIQESTYLTRRLKAGPGPVVDRLGLKRLGLGLITFRGSDSTRALSAFDADVVLLDEYDHMDPGVLASARARLGSSSYARIRLVSTPTFAETGINEWFMRSDQRYYYLPCPRCGEEQRLVWPDNIDFLNAKLVCRRDACRAEMNRWAEGKWKAHAPGNETIRGYHISRLYSTRANLPDIIRSFEADSFSSEQQFQNQVIGEVHNPEGGRITVADLDRNRRTYEFQRYQGQPCFMGVDAGKRLHVIIREKRPGRDKLSPLWFAGIVSSFDEMEGLLKRFNVQHCVLDYQPDYHRARDFAQRYANQVSLANYNRYQPGHVLLKRSSRDEVNVLSINRSEALDEMTQQVQKGSLPIPAVARSLVEPVRNGFGEYYREMMAPFRISERGSDGNWAARWSGNGHDHFAHAEVYCMCAQNYPLSNPGRVKAWGTW